MIRFKSVLLLASVALLVPQAGMANKVMAPKVVAATMNKVGPRVGAAVPQNIQAKIAALPAGLQGIISGAVASMKSRVDSAKNPLTMGVQLAAAAQVAETGYSCDASPAGTCAISADADAKLEAALASNGSNVSLENAKVFRKVIGKLLGLQSEATLSTEKTQSLLTAFVAKMKEGMGAISAMAAALSESLSGTDAFSGKTEVQMAEAIIEAC